MSDMRSFTSLDIEWTRAINGLKGMAMVIAKKCKPVAHEGNRWDLVIPSKHMPLLGNTKAIETMADTVGDVMIAVMDTEE